MKKTSKNVLTKEGKVSIIINVGGTQTHTGHKPKDKGPMGIRIMVVQRTLTPPVGVRFSHPQPLPAAAADGCRGNFFRGIAQLVARLVRDEEAVGSNPAAPTN